MRFSIVFTTDARDDLRLFRKGERTKIVNAIEELLSHDPAHETRNRKRLRPNQMAEWELRVDKFRVFYDIEESAHLVKVEAVGYKRGSRLLIHGEEYQL
jgi:mRNA-degrading endonuclease RelE of RelBE toxin-antitoxin system